LDVGAGALSSLGFAGSEWCWGWRGVQNTARWRPAPVRDCYAGGRGFERAIHGKDGENNGQKSAEWLCRPRERRDKQKPAIRRCAKISINGPGVSEARTIRM